MAESFKTQGTQIFFVDALGSDPVVVKMECPTAVQGLGGTSDNVDDTCLEDLVDRSFSPGLGSPGQVTIPFVLKQGAISHQLLFDIWDLKERQLWLIGLSDGTAEPTLVDGTLTPPPAADRTSLLFTAYIADINIDIATNEVVRGTLVLQRSGKITRTWKLAA